MQGLMLALSLLLAIAASTFLVQLLWWYYLENSDLLPGWIARSELKVPIGSSYLFLAVVSIFSMFLEMLVIRWISSEVRIFAYFKNFVLIACFLGFGIGCYLSRRRISVFAFLAPLLLLATLITSRLTQLRQFIEGLPAMLAPGTEVHIWGIPAIPLTMNSLGMLATGLLVSALLFLIIGFLFIPVGQLVGAALEKASNPVTAYTINVAASLFGILLYTALCLNFQPPAVWFIVAGFLFASTLLCLKTSRSHLIFTAIAFVACAGLSLPVSSPGRHTYWSPYQKLTIFSFPSATNPTHYELLTNDSWYQKIVNLSPEFVREHQEEFAKEPVVNNPYNLPYRFYPNPPHVLILGSGMGNDVAAALRNGAGAIVAVEIDPLILKLGRELHFEKPYDSPKVQVVVNDARNFIQNSKQKYDLIIFSLLDSHTTSSNYSNIRIDNFVYTTEGMKAAQQRLSEDGILIVKFQADRTWIAGRLENLLKTLFHSDPIRLSCDGAVYGTGGSFYVIGSRARLHQAMADPNLRTFVAANGFKSEFAQPTTDNWPYFYQQAPGIPLNVILLSGVLLIVCSTFIRRVTNKTSNMDWHFFYLGAAFLLLEAQIVSKVAMLFGTTWIVNSIVIGTLLALIIAANLSVHWHPDFSVRWSYVGIFLSLLVSWTIPVQSLLVSSLGLRVLLSALTLCLPAYFAGVIFIKSFSDAKSKSEALGSNLFGALAGGLLESLSFWTGLNALVLIALVLYFASALQLRSGNERAIAATSTGS